MISHVVRVIDVPRKSTGVHTLADTPTTISTYTLCSMHFELQVLNLFEEIQIQPTLILL